MNTKYDLAPSVLYDTIKTLEIGFNNSGYPNHMINQLSLKAFDEAWKSIDRGMVSLALFFSVSENISFFHYMFMDRLWDFYVLDELMKHMNDNRESIAKKALEFYGGKKISRSIELAGDDTQAIFEIIGSLPVNDRIKWEVAAFINNPKYILDNFFRLLNIVSRSIRRTQRENKEVLRDYRQNINLSLKRDSQGFLEEEHSVFSIYGDDVHNINITCSLITDTALQVTKYNNDVNIYLGINHSEKKKDAGKTVEFDKFFKALGDSNRMDVIIMLTEGEMYVGEIANRMGKSMSNISYHLDMLMTNGILKCRFEGKKAFFSIDKSNLSGILALFKLDFCDGNHSVDYNNSYAYKYEGDKQFNPKVLVRQ